MSCSYAKCFVSVGTTRFDNLCVTILSSEILKTLRNLGCKDLTMQIGHSDVEPRTYSDEGISINLYRFKDGIISDIDNANLIISHAGAGSCLEVLEAMKPLLVVVNEDLMDNHQIELAEQLQIDGHLYYCTCDTIQNTLEEVDFQKLIPFPKPDTNMFVKYLDSVLIVNTDK